MQRSDEVCSSETVPQSGSRNSSRKGPEVEGLWQPEREPTSTGLVKNRSAPWHHSSHPANQCAMHSTKSGLTLKRVQHDNEQPQNLKVVYNTVRMLLGRRAAKALACRTSSNERQKLGIPVMHGIAIQYGA